MVGVPSPDALAGASLETLQRLLVVLALAVSLAVVWLLRRPGGGTEDREASPGASGAIAGDGVAATLRRRFAMGVPWGTLVSLAGVVGFYLFAQGGLDNWYRPVVITYRSWTYLYPLGMLTGAFAHSGAGHLLGNVTSALVVMPVAEYAWGHFPTERGSTTFGGPLTDPWVRALVLFPAGVFLVGIATTVFAWGPLVGFSGVVFAAVGFALVRYPVATVLALLAQDGVGLAYWALQNPVLVRKAQPQFVTPWWSGVAVQGHALGLFLGAVAAIAVLYRRGLVSLPRLGARGDARPDPLVLWLGAVLAGLDLTLWAVWWYRGGDTYVLYRAVGLAVVLVVATLVVAAVSGPDTRPPIPAWLAAAFSTAPRSSLTARQAATLLFLIPLLSMSLAAVPINATTVDDPSPPAGAESIEVRDYTVFYAENVTDQMVGVVDVEALGESTRVTTSGLIVTSARRHVWSREVSTGRLAFDGTRRVVLGGPTWRTEIVVQRRGWSAAGGPAAYKVWLWRAAAGEEARILAHASEPATADPVIAGRNVSVVPAREGFRLRVTRNNTTLGETPMPTNNTSVAAGDITFVRDGRRVIARQNGTRVEVAKEESYE